MYVWAVPGIFGPQAHSTENIMLKLMRDNLKSLSWILAFVVAAFVFAVFADYGGQGSWIASSGSAGGDWAARVDGETISRRAFLNAARNLDGYYRSLLGESYNRENLNLRVGQQAINQLVQEELILAHARRLGFTATAEEISRAIVEDPAFQGPTGFIGEEKYKAFLRSNGSSYVAFEEGLARVILRRKWAEVLTADIAVSDDQVALEVRRQDETADVSYAQFRTADYIDQIKIENDDLSAWYAANEKRYQRGEGRSFDLVVLDRLRAQTLIQVPEEEARAQYGAALTTRFTIPEQRRASHILIKTAQGSTDADFQTALTAANAALARVQAGEEFAQVASEISGDTSAANGGDLGFFPHGVMAIPFEKAVWEMSEISEISSVVQTQFGYHIIQLTGIQDARLKEFEEVREELEREISFAQAGEKVRSDAEAFAAAVRSSPTGFEDEAARLSIVTTDSGVIFPGDPIPGIGSNPEIQRALFSLAQDEISEPVPIARGYLVARFRESHPGGAPPLAEVRETVLNDLKAERAAALATEKAATAVSAGADLTATAEAQGFTLEEATAVRRGASVGSLGVSAAMDEALFEGEIAALQGPLDMPAGPVILSVTSRVEVGEDEIRARAAEIRDTLVAGRRQQLLSAITRELSLEADVTYNTLLIQQVDDPTAAATTTGS
jgi:peptidyl-prolyl cis-trans isomerase D